MNFSGLTNDRLLTVVPDFASPPRSMNSLLHSNVALGAAPRLTAFTGRYPVQVLNQRFVLQGRDKIAELENFFWNQSGKYEVAWVVSWAAELEPTANVDQTDTELTIAAVGYEANYLTTSSEELGKYIFLLSTTGTVHIAQVTAVVVDGANEVLTFTPAAPQDFTLGRFFVGFVYLCRMNSDTLSLEYSSIDSATAELSFVQTVGQKDGVESGTWTEVETVPVNNEDNPILLDIGENPLDYHIGGTFYIAESVYVWSGVEFPDITSDMVSCHVATAKAEFDFLQPITIVAWYWVPNDSVQEKRWMLDHYENELCGTHPDHLLDPPLVSGYVALSFVYSTEVIDVTESGLSDAILEDDTVPPPAPEDPPPGPEDPQPTGGGHGGNC